MVIYDNALEFFDLEIGVLAVFGVIFAIFRESRRLVATDCTLLDRNPIENSSNFVYIAIKNIHEDLILKTLKYLPSNHTQLLHIEAGYRHPVTPICYGVQITSSHASPPYEALLCTWGSPNFEIK
jgi:hypothetical protein